MTQYALLWSASQNCLHIEPLNELLQKNLKAFAVGSRLNDYHPIFVGSRDECDKVANQCREALIARDMARDD